MSHAWSTARGHCLLGFLLSGGWLIQRAEPSGSGVPSAWTERFELRQNISARVQVASRMDGFIATHWNFRVAPERLVEMPDLLSMNICPVYISATL